MLEWEGLLGFVFVSVNLDVILQFKCVGERLILKIIRH